jgi:hypothetical protein
MMFLSPTARKTTSLRQASAFGRRSRPSADEDGWQSKGDRWVSEFVEVLKTELESTFKEEISVYFDINPHEGLYNKM